MSGNEPCGCIFCDIVAGTAPAGIVHKDDVLDRFFHALDNFQESPSDLSLLKTNGEMDEALQLLRGE